MGDKQRENQMVDCFLVTVQAYSSPRRALGVSCSVPRLYQSNLTPRNNWDYNLLLVTSLETAGLGVEVLVAILNQLPDQFRSGVFLPLNGPVHGGVCDNEGGNNVENLVAETAEDVEDGSVTSTGEGTLTVRGQRVGSDALGGRATCETNVSILPWSCRSV